MAKLLAPFGVKYNDERKSSQTVAWMRISAGMEMIASSRPCMKMALHITPDYRPGIYWWRLTVCV
jgi:hypothetical protein